MLDRKPVTTLVHGEEKAGNERMEIKRDPKIDLLKAIAIFGVIVIHTCGLGYSNAILSSDWCAAVFLGKLNQGKRTHLFHVQRGFAAGAGKKADHQKIVHQKFSKNYCGHVGMGLFL